MQIWLDKAEALLFCDNETNTQALYGTPNKTSYPKDAFHSTSCNDQRGDEPGPRGDEGGRTLHLRARPR